MVQPSFDQHAQHDLLLFSIFIALIGVFTQIGQLGLTKAMKTLTADKASAYSYIQIILSTLIGIARFDEIPSTWTYLGGILTVSGALVHVFGHKLSSHRYKQAHLKSPFHFK
ncbi:EamA-like transporter family protein [Vibrio gazogenes DSM 21264]|uniref:EamA-like transporter family protein n=1 Tax=Vibrio gazogenes DSM 21264 = NBRC 103151 TaxID=1123492 RepID=A0A1M4T240_VIBGA|nr:DMT family transporter [Vibrio gazogenes]USP16003.1 DMT family transporter [Vibrio gazogenes]SHE38494.1 EamA-like transporter family protein [Vibrio gazogenes DSM 21264] [Vibrio gazogenes DSM 21264 = NBRC 103151]SJN54694.1 EamA-like transporter family protein [Vibrio gazogenes]